ncbi:uncharacterized protein E6C27_scaffold21G00150 [Cucumis melo var. makuwa]|uniref:Uncharacterized protein n=1 Tax=Cucumis melo var. makuwa TaxID=1194695 RepID=A0A5A7VCI1_CUCMM|nr:uncharacterized protein E6C27_scaffold21G00150 [Cucumis melo var. makuwa]
MAMSDRESKKGKGIAFKSTYEQETTVNQSEINSEVDSECFDIDEDEELTLEKLKMLRKEDSEARAIQNKELKI